MSIKITNSVEKITPAKRTIKLNNIYIEYLKFVDDENGDITQQVIDNLPYGTKTVDFKINVDLIEEEPTTNDSCDE